MVADRSYMFLQCFVFGDSNAGKTSLIEGLLRQEGQEAEQQPQEAGSPRTALAPKIAVNEVVVSRDHRGRQHQGEHSVLRMFYVGMYKCRGHIVVLAAVLKMQILLSSYPFVKHTVKRQGGPLHADCGLQVTRQCHVACLQL